MVEVHLDDVRLGLDVDRPERFHPTQDLLTIVKRSSEASHVKDPKPSTLDPRNAKRTRRIVKADGSWRNSDAGQSAFRIGGISMKAKHRIVYRASVLT